jgi:signal transduction histidine kinase
MAAWKRAAVLPDSPGTVPSSLAARFELSAKSPEDAARLYQDLHAGAWTLEKSPYAYYEEQLRTWAADRIPETVRAAEQERQAMSRILERAVVGESGWLKDSGVAALVVLSTKGRPSAIIVRDSPWQEWLEEASRELPGDLRARMDAEASPDSKTAALALAPLGLPGSVWAEAADPTVSLRENESRRRLLLAILFAVAGVLAFGTFATVWIVRRELQVAQMQADFTATVSHEFRSPLTGIRQLGEMLLAGRAANDEARRRQYYELICRESDRLTRLVENVLDFARMEDGRKEYQMR